MAKSKTTKAKKLTAKELEEVKNLQNQINTVVLNIGNQELIKNQLASRHTQLQAEWKDMTISLEEKYGSVNISLEDGAITEVEEKEEETTLA
jgi:uncharacterized protein